MPELPEISSRAREMNNILTGRTIQSIEVIQPKCLNLPVPVFSEALEGAEILHVYNRGKWIFVETSRGYLLLNLGMGGEILLTCRGSLPEKRRLVIYLDGEYGEQQPCLSINFWWFGHAHYVEPGALDKHVMTARLGPNATSVSAEELKVLLTGQRGRIKTFLLDQSHLAGIGNAYIHDILFMARLHPLRPVSSLSGEEIESLHRAILNGLEPSMAKGGAFYELDLQGNKGGFLMEDILIGYREGQPCPVCGTAIEKIKTGSTSSFLCPLCQPLENPGS